MVYTIMRVIYPSVKTAPRRQAAPRPFSSLNRRMTGVPLYIQIVENLTERIKSGALVPGHRLPPERELSEMLKVNRMTLRQALNSLEAHGLLVRRQGDGTYVADSKIERQAGKLVPFTQGMQRRGYKPGAKVITLEQQPADAAIAKELHLRTSEPVYHIHRLRLINQEPVMLESFTLPVSRFPGLERHNLANRSAYEVMETEYGVTISRARQSLEPTIATEYEAEQLHIKPGAPLMLETRLAFDQHDQPVEYGRDLYRGDRFRFITEVAPLE